MEKVSTLKELREMKENGRHVIGAEGNRVFLFRTADWEKLAYVDDPHEVEKFTKEVRRAIYGGARGGGKTVHPFRLFIELANRYEVAKENMGANERELQRDMPAFMRSIRYACGDLTQAELAKELGVDHTTISKIEGGVLQASGDVILGLRDFLLKHEGVL